MPGDIGGLAAALALRNCDVASVVLEQADHLKPVGTGIQLTPNAIQVRARLGVLDAIVDGRPHVAVNPLAERARIRYDALLSRRNVACWLENDHIGARPIVPRVLSRCVRRPQAVSDLWPTRPKEAGCHASVR